MSKHTNELTFLDRTELTDRELAQNSDAIARVRALKQIFRRTGYIGQRYIEPQRLLEYCREHKTA